MSTAHRPTWDPAQAKDVKGGSRQVSARDKASYTKLKFRQPGQTSSSEVATRDLRRELLEAEQLARERKRKAEGKTPLEDEPTKAITAGSSEEGEANKRRKMLQEALELDRDDDDNEDSEDGKEKGSTKDEDVSDEDEDDSDEEDDTAELMRELERIKRERAEEKERLEHEKNASAQIARDEEIATANPLLNLAAALGQNTGVRTNAPGTFAVKRRWDDDLIFKNQAASASDRPSGQFVNDLLRTEFHKKFMSRFIK